ncbi:ORF6N domain-containing protein, partial [Romboutsia sp. 1001216sp1]
RESKINEIQVLGTQEFMGKQVPVIEGGFGIGQKVVLAKTVAEIHEQRLDKVNELINNNIDEFEEGIDFLDLKVTLGKGYNFEELGFNKMQVAKAKNIYILSEQGYMCLISFMKTEKAKELRKKFRREYFSMRETLRVLTREQELVLDLYEGSNNVTTLQEKRRTI